MTQHRNYEAVASIVTEMADKRTQFGMAIKDYTMISPELVSVVATVSEVDEDKINEKLLEDTEGTVSVVPKSVREVDNPKQTTARFFAVANIQTQDATTEVMDKLVEIQANVYADEENNAIWELNGEGENQYLVQQSSDNLEEIFEARRDRRMQAGQSHDGHVAFASGDFAAYASGNGTIRTGMLYETDDGLQIADFQSQRRVELNPMQILCAAELNEEDDDEVDQHELRSNLATRQGTDILNYFRKLYGGNPAFFNKLTQLVRNHDGKIQLVETNPDINEMLRQNVAR